MQYTPVLGHKDAVFSVLKYVFCNMSSLRRVFLPIFILFCGLWLIYGVVLFTLPAAAELLHPLLSLLVAYSMTVFAINWHKMVINGPEYYQPMRFFRPTRHEFMFMLAAFFIPIIAVMVSMPLMSFVGGGAVVSLVIMIVFYLIFFSIILKFSFYFPARAIGEKITLISAFKMTTGYVTKMFVVGIIASLLGTAVFVCLYMLVSYLYIAALGAVISPEISEIVSFTISSILDSLIELLMIALGVTIICNYYLIAQEQNGQAPSAASDGSY